MVKKDENIKNEIKKLIQEVDRNAVFSRLKQWGDALWAIFLVVLGVALKFLFDFLSSPKPH